MAPERLVVVGGDAAGMSAASQARRRRGPDDLEIVAFDRGNYTSYSACGIPYFVGDVVPSAERLIARDPETFRAKFAIDARVRHDVEEIDLDRRAVRVRDIDAGTSAWEPFDTLMVGTGAVPLRPRLAGADAKGIYGVQTLDDGLAVRAALNGSARRVVVVGAGYIGIEMAEAMKLRGLDVTVVARGAQPMSTLDDDMGELLREAMSGLGIDVHTGCAVTGFDVGADGQVRAVETEHGEFAADLVVLGLGVRPNSDLAAAAGLTVGVTGGVVTDLRMRTSAEGVWAAGDCVETYHLVARKPVAIALGTHANKQGRVAGINIGGGYATFPGVVGTAVSKVCDLEIARTGLKEAEATAAGFRFVTVKVESTTRAGYYPGAAPITTKIIAERRSGRLLGAQIVGREGAAKRIDALATALWNDMTVDAMLNMDLSYAPPFAPVWDPVLIASRKAWEAVEADVVRDPAGGYAGSSPRS
ncbi:MAG: FAD-dependent oxidoreductase [Mycobacteriales bacterium]|nr:FAD-dependent oxidoreductase [Frankia sp.]